MRGDRIVIGSRLNGVGDLMAERSQVFTVISKSSVFLENILILRIVGEDARQGTLRSFFEAVVGRMRVKLVEDRDWTNWLLEIL